MSTALASITEGTPTNLHEGLRHVPSVHFVPYPAHSPPILSVTPRERGAAGVAQPIMTRKTLGLFVRQVAEQLRLEDICALLSTLTDGVQFTGQARGAGRFHVRVPADQSRAARELNGRVLFDRHGVWHAVTNTARQKVSAYLKDFPFPEKGPGSLPQKNDGDHRVRG